VALTLPTVGGDNGVWSSELNAALSNLDTRHFGRVLLVASNDAPSNVKAAADYVCDGTADDVEIQAAIWAMHGSTAFGSVNGAGCVYFSTGIFNITHTLLLPTRIRLIGQITADGAQSTTFNVPNGSNCDAIKTEGACHGRAGTDKWWHYGGIERIAFQGNRVTVSNPSGNTWGTGVHLGSSGEQTILRGVQCTRFARDGFRNYGGTPNQLEYCGAWFNGRHGFNVSPTNMLLVQPSGDGNEGAFLRVTNAAQGGLGALTILHPKIERPGSTSSATAQDPAIVSENNGGALTIIGGSIDGSADNTRPSHGAIARTNPPMRAVQHVWLSGQPTGGSFVITADSGKFVTLNVTDDAAAAQAKFDTALGSGNTLIEGVPGDWEITYQGVYDNTNPPEIDVNSISLTGGTTPHCYFGKMEYGYNGGANPPVPTITVLGLRQSYYALAYEDQTNSANNVAGSNGGSTSLTILPTGYVTRN
jgi:hypothetical protein